MTTDPAVAPAPNQEDAEQAKADFMPLDGWDYVELWVGNAKQAAYFYEHALGFTRTAYAGPETGVRDRASYVLEQGEHPLRRSPRALREDHDIARHCRRHGDGVKDIALAVPDATEAYRQAVQRGARGVVEPHRVEDDCGVDRARRDRDLRRHDPHLRQPRATTRARSCPATSRSPASAGAGVGLDGDRPRRRQRRARPDERVGRLLRAGLRDDRDDPLLRRGHLDRVLGADVEGR